MPDLTTCPTCGLPAELVEHSATLATARCVLLHDFTVDIEPIDVRTPPPAPQATVVQLPIAEPPARREWARRMAWFLFGALAALLLTRYPPAAIVLIPLSLPFIGVEAARKSWRPLGVRPVVEQVVAQPDADRDAEAA